MWNLLLSMFPFPPSAMYFHLDFNLSLRQKAIFECISYASMLTLQQFEFSRSRSQGVRDRFLSIKICHVQIRFKQ